MDCYGIELVAVGRQKIVIFKTIRVRDHVARLAPKLASALDISGVCPGIRMEILQLLLTTFKLLERHGHLLRNRHGPTLKRHVKLDDVEINLVMGVKLPGDESWVRMTPDFVKSLKKGIPKQTTSLK